MSTILTREEIQENLSMLNEGLEENERWTLSDNAIEKTFTFKSFIRAFGWMSQIAIWAEKLKHQRTMLGHFEPTFEMRTQSAKYSEFFKRSEGVFSSTSYRSRNARLK